MHVFSPEAAMTTPFILKYPRNPLTVKSSKFKPDFSSNVSLVIVSMNVFFIGQLAPGE